MTFHHDAFISYSHGSDAALATALEAGLERLAKPVFRLRAMDVFRDKSSLAANPGLWSGIESHLSASQWFVLMASPASAASPWCNKEIAWWLEQRSAATLLIALTDGDIAWDGHAADFDWARTSALAPGLRGRFPEEPLYVDLRWARSESKLALNDSRFRSVVLDLAATIRGLPKDQLDGEDVRQLARTKRLARAGVTAIAIAAAVAVWQAVEATRQRDRALSRQLAAQASDLRVQEPVLSLLLAAQALAVGASTEAATSLMRALKAAPFERIVEHDEALQSLAVSQDEKWAVAGDGRAATQRVELATGIVERVIQATIGPGLNGTLAVALSADGRSVASGGFDQAITIATEGGKVRTIAHGVAHEGFILGLAFSPDGRTLASAGTDGRVLLHDLTAGSRTTLKQPWKPEMSAVRFSPDGRVLAAGGDDGTLILYRPAGARQTVPDRSAGASSVMDLVFARDGSELFCAFFDRIVALYDVASGRLKARLEAPELGWLESMAVAPDGNRVFTGHSDGAVLIWKRGSTDSDWSREILYRHSAQVQGVAFLPRSDRLVSIGFDGRLYVTRPALLPPVARERWRSSEPFARAVLVPGENRVVLTMDERVAVADAESGKLISVGAAAAAVAAKADKKDRVITDDGHGQAVLDSSGKLLVTRPHDGGTPVEMRESARESVLAAKFSPDGRTLYALHQKELRAWNTGTGALRGTASQAPAGLFPSIAVSADGRLLAVKPGLAVDFGAAGRRKRSEGVVLLRARDLKVLAESLEAIPGTDLSQAESLFFTPDAHLLALQTGSHLTLWDLAGMQRVDEAVPLPHHARALGFAGRDDKLLLALPASNAILELDLAAEAWARQACRIAGRSLTRQEWARYVGPDFAYRPACRDGSYGD